MEKDGSKNLEPFVFAHSLLEKQIGGAVEPIIAAQGFELVHLRVTGQKSHAKVALYIDRQDAEGSISIDQLEFLNRLIGDALDVADAEQRIFSGSYDLEVSSPGLDRPLGKKSHFEKAMGKLVQIKTDGQMQRPKSLTGTLLEVNNRGVAIEPKGSAQVVQVPWEGMRDAHVVFVFAPKKTSKNIGKGSLKRR